MTQLDIDTNLYLLFRRQCIHPLRRWYLPVGNTAHRLLDDRARHERRRSAAVRLPTAASLPEPRLSAPSRAAGQRAHQTPHVLSAIINALATFNLILTSQHTKTLILLQAIKLIE